MANETILVIEDEKNILELIKYNLKERGYQTITTTNGKSGLEIALESKPHLILLDLMLPGMSGLEICKMFKQNYKTRDIPIIMLTARTEETDIVLGLELGADDYITKPFSPKQFLARVKAVLRRYQGTSHERVLKAGNLFLDTAKHIVMLNGKTIDLTSKEFGILKLFMESGERVLSREYILDTIWGRDESLNVEFRAVDKHIGELRKKLKSESERIMTIKSYGYRFISGISPSILDEVALA